MYKTHWQLFGKSLIHSYQSQHCIQLILDKKKLKIENVRAAFCIACCKVAATE
jgi:hypothetical protein